MQSTFKWVGGIIAALLLLAVVAIALFDWNWLRGKIEREVLAKTGRELSIRGNLSAKLSWPAPRLRAESVTFANPPWASERQMIAAEAVEVTVDLPALLRRQIVFSEVHLQKPKVNFEKSADGRKNWLLDIEQLDENARIRIGRLTLDQGQMSFLDSQDDTHIDALLSTPAESAPADPAMGVAFSAKGKYKGLPLAANGHGGPVLAIRDESEPYALNVDATIGRTVVKAVGHITSLLTLTALDLRLDLSGDSLAQLFPLLNISFPETHPYRVKGHLQHSEKMWRYQNFSGRIGNSDVTGTLQVDAGSKRSFLHGELAFAKLDFNDLGPVVGMKDPVPSKLSGTVGKPGQPAAVKPAATLAATPTAKPAPKPVAGTRMLPDIPFRADRWDSIDAEVSIRAQSILRDNNLPLENFSTVLKLHDAVLTLDPLNFGLAGGNLLASVSLDGRQDPIHAKVKLRARKILINKLFPAADITKSSVGQINGEFDLSGSGNSVGRMLATANGKVGLVIADGEISKLMLEYTGLHLWEILQLKLAGDKTVKIRCGVGNFNVKSGVMNADALVLDTAVSTVTATGTIDLDKERLDITIRQNTKNTSLVALRGPIYVRGSFAKPDITVDVARVTTRGAVAIALGLINPLLALLPLVETGPGTDSDCGRLMREARALKK